ncbi:MAG: hypothetical protein ACFB21_07575 [Opitutales bacterium]
MVRFCLRFPIVAILAIALSGGAFAQSSETDDAALSEAPVVAPEAPAADNTSSQIIAALHASVEAKREEVTKLETRLEEATNDTARAQISQQLQRSAQELAQLQREFERAVSGVDLDLFVEAPEPPFSWEEKLGEILQPVLAEIEASTAEGRQIAELEEKVDQLSAQFAAADAAEARISELLEVTEEGSLREALERQRDIWLQRETVVENQADAAELRLQELRAQQDGFLEGSTATVRDFVSNRGRNLLLALLAFVVAYVGVRMLFGAVQRALPAKKQGLGNRVLALSAQLLSILAAVGAVIVALNILGDVFLLGIVLIVLLGAAWAGVKILPQYFEAIKIVLNLGPVREDECLVYQGLPWRVDTLGFQSILLNEHLDGGRLRLPVRFLLDHLSRPLGEKERLFPCDRSDWVALADGRTGEVIAQNPTLVTIRELGGAECSYATADFLAQQPRNLSHGYRVETRFGIDYAHQAIATTTVPDIMEAALREHLPTGLPPECVRKVRVEFAAAAASALEFEAEVDLSGDAAAFYEETEFALQRILVDTCNTHDWTIPFTQVTLHQASGATSSAPHSGS